MATLGFDTATDVLTIAVTRGGEVAAEGARGPGPDGRPRHSALLLAEVERCVADSGGWDEIERIAVGLGPGSYTGLRIGIATARALAQARQLELRGISTLSALARGIRELPEAAGRPRLAILDARRGQAFAELHAVGAGRRGARWCSRRRSWASSPRARSRRDGGGDGALRFRAELEAVGATVAPPGTRPTGSRRGTSARSRTWRARRPGRIEPIYLRGPMPRDGLRDRGDWADAGRGGVRICAGSPTATCRR